MPFDRIFARRTVVVGLIVAAVLAVGGAFALEPITRTVFADQFFCFGCHQRAEYDTAAVGSPSRVHRATPEGGETRCVDCHVPTGWVASVFVYTHFLGHTDLFGREHDYKFFRILDPVLGSDYQRQERHGAAVTPIAKKAYSVRDRLAEYDSSPCRTCHIEEEIKPTRKRGQKAHKRALENRETCIECHYNLVHREVEVRLE